MIQRIHAGIAVFFVAAVQLFCGLEIRAQAMTGRILQERTATAIAGASIVLLPKGQGVISGEQGTFRLTGLPAGRHRVEISAVGYKTLQAVLIIRPGNGGETDSLHLQEFFLSPAENTLGEVVITGVSRATLVRANPVPISTVSGAAIRRTTAPNVMDALVRHVPGLHVVKTGPNISKPFIRGLGYNRVLTLYDGLRQEGQQWGDEHGVEVDAYAVDRAEVLKGPASLMFGSDALAGVVSLFPDMPKEKDGSIETQLVTEYQSNNGLLGTGLKLGSGGAHWLWSARGSVRLAKNYRNAADGRVYNTGFSEKNASLLLGYSSGNGYSHLNATLYDNLQGIPDGSRDSLSRRFTKQVYEGLQDDIASRPIVPESELNTYRLSPLHQHIQHYRIYNNSHYRLGAGELDLLGGFQQNIRREYNHPTRPDQPGLYVRLNTVNYSARYNITIGSSTDISFGVNGMQQSNRSLDATDFPIPDYHLWDIGGFGFARWKNRQLTLSGGLRYDLRRLRSGDFFVRSNPVTGFDQQAHYPDTTGARLPFPAFGRTFTGISASMGLTWQINEALYIKSNIARGYRAPNITEIASNGLDPGAHIVYLGNRNFAPEYSLQQDIGIGAHYGGLNTSFSFFHNAIQNYIYLSLVADAQGNPVVDAQGNRTFQYQQAAARLYGVEASVEWRPAFLKNFVWTNDCSLVYGFNRKDIYKDKGIQGEYLPLVPPLRWISSISRTLEIRSPVFPSLTLHAETEYNAAQNRYMALYNTETATPSYMLFNAGLEMPVHCASSGDLQLVLQVSNLFNSIYQSHVSRLKYFEYYTSPPDGRSGIYSMGRNYCIKLIWKG
ncbi:MAG: TonB-dependent receptor, partial [Bacteroidetes bacterium]|nr:TonB-dependent receptor [Bacteroidota bacterium]